MKKLLILISMFCFLSITNAEEINPELIDVELIKCENANYSYFNINGKNEFVRLLSFNREDGELNNEIDSFVCDTLKNASNIKIEYDKNIQRDEYNRLYAYVYVNDELLQKILIQKGYGQVSNIQGKYKYLDELCNNQKNAITNSLGIWNYSNIKEEYCNSNINIKNSSNIAYEKSEIKKIKSDNYLNYIIFVSSSILLIVLIKRYKKTTS